MIRLNSIPVVEVPSTRPSSEPVLSLSRITHAYGEDKVVRGLSFTLDRGAIGCLLGPSGCGKTTVLRCIAGFEAVQSGEIWLAKSLVSSPRILVPPERRRIGMVFQDYALFPHLTVAGNVAFGLHSLPDAERRRRAGECMEVTGLTQLARQYPHELSGGQQQRVALARALAPRPDLLLLDEPFSNLDVELREQLGQEVREIVKRFDIACVLVTHDQNEAFAVADEIGVMHQGEIQQWDTAYNLYHRPRTRFIADFIGQGVLFPGAIVSSKQVRIELGMLDGEIPAMCEIGCDACGRGCAVDVLLRPDDIVHDDHSDLKAAVLQKAFRGAEILYTLRLDSGRKVLALVPSHHNHALGERIGIRLDVDHVVTFAPEAAVR